MFIIIIIIIIIIIEKMIMVIKVIGGCLSSKKLEIVIPNRLPKKEVSKLLVLLQAAERIYLMR